MREIRVLAMEILEFFELISSLFEAIGPAFRLIRRIVGWTVGLFRKPRDSAYLTIETNSSAERQGFRSITYSRRKPRLSRYIVR